MDTLHPLTLSQHFRTLTVVWVVPLSGLKFTPEPPFIRIYDAETFGVGRGIDLFRNLNPKPVALPFQRSHLTLD